MTTALRALERTWQITAGAIWTLLMLSVGAASGSLLGCWIHGGVLR